MPLGERDCTPLTSWRTPGVPSCRDEGTFELSLFAEALHEALDELPKGGPGRKAVYLAEVVERLLGLPADRETKRAAA